MNAYELGSPDWWTVVLSMPLQERVDHLNGYKHSLLEQHSGKASHATASSLLARVNHEIKKANMLINESCWQTACRKVLTEEQFLAVQEAKRMAEGWT